MYQVFGGQTLDDLVDLGYTREHPDIGCAGEDDDAGDRVFAIRGFVSRPQVQKLNRNSIYLFVNGRLIRDKLLMHALSAAYHNLMPPACYPFALLFLDCDAEEVDVNVHPSKTEVRFRHGSFVHDFVRDTIRNVLMESRPVSAIPLPVTPQPAAELPYSEFTQANRDGAFRGAGAGSDACDDRCCGPAGIRRGHRRHRLRLISAAGIDAHAGSSIPDTHGSHPI